MIVLPGPAIDRFVSSYDSSRFLPSSFAIISSSIETETTMNRHHVSMIETSEHLELTSKSCKVLSGDVVFQLHPNEANGYEQKNSIKYLGFIY